MATYHFIMFTKKSGMVITNDNTHKISQKLKLYFVEIIFHPQSMLFMIVVACNLIFGTIGTWWYMLIVSKIQL